MAEKTYWLGKGQVKIDRKLYKHGEEIPADKVDGKKLKEWKDAGDTGTASFAHKPGRPTSDVKLLQGKLAEVKSELEDAEISILEKDEKISELEADVAKMTKQLKDKKKDKDK